MYIFSQSRRRPPISTLFPYTTLFRSQQVPDISGGSGPSPHPPIQQVPDISGGSGPSPHPPIQQVPDISGGSGPSPHPPIQQVPDISGGRSEEHTSELQSLAYLVCRLLLEKKKTLHLPDNHTLALM